MADHDRRLLFGIGQEQQAQVEVQWPCGAIQKLTVQAGASETVQEAGCRLAKKSPKP